MQRASLALDAGKVIIGYGGNDGDCGSYHGWLVSVAESGGGSLQSFEVDGKTGESQGAIWGSGNAPAIDSAGDIWVSTGNGNSSAIDYQESVIKLNSNLQVVDWWSPSNWKTLDQSDTDLGSSMPLLLPDGLVFEIGKAGVGYLLNASNLGHGVGTPLYSASVCSGSWGGGIYVNGVVYVTCRNGLHAITVNPTAKTFAPLAGWTVNSNAVGPPILAGGLVWSVGTSVGASNGGLYGLDATTGATSFSANLGGYEHFTTPSAGGGMLFVANQDQSAGNAGQITAFRIANPPSPPPSPPPPPPPSPKISHLHVAAVHGKLRLRLALSEPASLKVVVWKLATGRMLHGRCLVGVRRGHRCQTRIRKLILRVTARQGSDALRPRMRRLPPGRYLLTVTAIGSGGARSQPRTALVVVPRH